MVDASHPSGPSVGQDRAPVLTPARIVLGATVRDKGAAIDLAGRLLVGSGAVRPEYVEAMHRRERSISTYLGRGVAVPHGNFGAKQAVLCPAVCVIRLAAPIDWNGNGVRYVVSIAAEPREHLRLLGKVGRLFSEPPSVAALDAATTPEQVIDVMARLNA